jgi:hypothetical protein
VAWDLAHCHAARERIELPFANLNKGHDTVGRRDTAKVICYILGPLATDGSPSVTSPPASFYLFRMEKAAPYWASSFAPRARV